MSNLTFLYETDRLGVRGLSDLELTGNYPNWFSDLEVCRYNRHGQFPVQPAECLRYIEGLRGDRSQVVWAVYAKDEMKHIGNISLQGISWIDRSAEFAVLFGEREYWGRGFAFEASKLLLHHGFTKLNLRRIACGTTENNLGMRKLASSLGMEQEGLRRQAVFWEGRHLDVIEFGVLRKEFLGV